MFLSKNLNLNMPKLFIIYEDSKKWGKKLKTFINKKSDVSPEKST